MILPKFYLNKGHFKNQSFPQSWLFSVLCAIGNDGDATLLKGKARGRGDCTPHALDEPLGTPGKGELLQKDGARSTHMDLQEVTMCAGTQAWEGRI